MAQQQQQQQQQQQYAPYGFAKPFAVLLHVRKGQEAVLDWRLPTVAQEDEPVATPDETYQLTWNPESSEWQMPYGALQGMPREPWNYSLMKLEIYAPLQPDPIYGAKVKSVEDYLSVIQPEGTLDTETNYRIRITEASPGQMVNVFQKGPEKAIEQFNRLYQSNQPLPYIQFVNTETVADLTLEISYSEWIIYETAQDAHGNQPMVFGIESDQEDWAIRKLTENLNKVVKWRQVLELTNTSTQIAADEIEIAFQTIDEEGEVLATHTDPSFAIELEKSGNRYEAANFRITAQNRSKQNLHLKVFYLSRFYGIRDIASSALNPGGETIDLFSSQLTISNPEALEEKGTFKIIISDQPMQLPFFDQEKIDFGSFVTRTRFMPDEEEERYGQWPTEMDWTEQTFEVLLKAKGTSSESLAELKERLHNILADGIAVCIDELKKVLPESSEKFSTLLILENRYYEANRNQNIGDIPEEDLAQLFDQVRDNLSQFIDSLTEDDLRPNAPRKSNGRRGQILYRIPRNMLLGEETACLVRIASDEKILVKDLERDEQTQIKSIRMSGIMRVEILDPSDTPSVEFRTVSTSEQFVVEDDFTEWLFYAKPVTAGPFPIMIKVTVLEVVDGKERAKEIVLEEKINIGEPQIQESAYTVSEEAPPIQQQQSSFAPESASTYERVSNWSEVSRLIEDGKTRQALELAIELAGKNDRKMLYERLMQLTGRLNKLQKDMEAGIIPQEEADVENNRIVVALLDLITEDDAAD